MFQVDPLIDVSSRPAREDDRKFIVETTAKVRKPHEVPWLDWREGGQLEAKSILDNGSALVSESEGVIIGFALWTGSKALAMLYVKRDFRGLGIGKQLLGPLPEVLQVTRPTPCWRQWTRYHKIRWQAP